MPDDILPQTPSRRRFIGVAAAAVVAGSLSRLAFADTNQSIAEVAHSSGGDKTAIRPLHVHAPESQLIDLKRRVKATRWPERETVTDASQGVQLATMQKLARYWSTDYDWRKVEARLNALPQFVTDDRHARMARFDHRAVEDHRSADRSGGPRRKRIGFVRHRDSVVAGLRVLGQADRNWLGSSARCTRLGRTDEASRLHAICRAGRRLGQCCHGADGSTGTARTDWHSHQHAGYRAGRYRRGTQIGPAGAGRPFAR